MTYVHRGFNLQLNEVIFEFTALKQELQMQTTKSKRNILSMTWRGDFGCRRFFLLLSKGIIASCFALKSAELYLIRPILSICLNGVEIDLKSFVPNGDKANTRGLKFVNQSVLFSLMIGRRPLHHLP